MNQSEKNYYEVLEISPSATDQEIHEGYVRTKNAYSGDSVALYSLLSKEECESALENIETAYSVLSDPQKKQEYDKIKGFEKSKRQKLPMSEISKNNPNTYNLKSSDFNQNTSDSKTEQRNTNYDIKENEYSISRISGASKFKLHFEPNDEFEQEIENTSIFTGEFLKKIREYKNVSVERMAELTKISKTYIRQIESEDKSKLPALVYVRGFVYQYAKCLKLSPDLVATSYLNHIKSEKI